MINISVKPEIACETIINLSFKNSIDE